MAAPKTKKTGNSEKMVKPVNSVHIVVYACTNCGEELEELKLCRECDSPMKVIQVVEKYGAEADEYLAQLKKNGSWAGDAVHPTVKEDVVADGGISEDDLDKLDFPINGIEEESVDDEPLLGDIFPDDDDDDDSTPASRGGDIDFMEALDKLDEEEDVEDLHDLGPDGLPEL